MWGTFTLSCVLCLLTSPVFCELLLAFAATWRSRLIGCFPVPAQEPAFVPGALTASVAQVAGGRGLVCRCACCCGVCVLWGLELVTRL